MKRARCVDCGTLFYRDENETWRKRCLPCFKKSKRVESMPVDSYWLDRALAAEKQVAELQCQLYSERRTVEVLINGKQGSSLDRELAENWRALVQLVHPDKHGGSVAANRITQWLNGIKGRLPCD